MKGLRRMLAALLLALCPLLCGASAPPPCDMPGAQQLVLVAAFADGTAELSFYERDGDGAWTQLLTAPAILGVGGLGKTREGDGKTPTGVFRFNAAFGTEEDPGCAIPYHLVTPDDYWSCDQREGYRYNRLVSILELPGLDTSCSEHLCDIVPQYRYALSIDYNAAGEQGKGSAIFLHCTDGTGAATHGCVAIPEAQMLELMRAVRPDCVLVIGELEALRS